MTSAEKGKDVTTVPSNRATVNYQTSRLQLGAGKVLEAEQVNIFATRTSTVHLNARSKRQNRRRVVAPISARSTARERGLFAGEPALGRLSEDLRERNTLTGLFKETAQQGSYNIVVNSSGVSPVSGQQFVTKEMVSVFAQ